MNYMNDLKMVYLKAIKETEIRIKKNPVVLLFPMIYGLLIFASTIIFGMFTTTLLGNTYIMGFLAPVLYSLIMSSYFEFLSDINSYNRIRFNNIGNTFTKNFRQIYSVYFIMILISYITSFVGDLYFILSFVIFILLNPISEAVYIRGESYISAYSYSLEFMKDNALHWLVPLFIYLGVIYLAVGKYDTLTLLYNPISLLTGIKFNAANIFKFVGSSFLTAVYVIFRGALFNILSRSTMRKRQYMGEI
ncbi:hypothetical protein [Peptoniphilus sp. oral taxon 386]|uniref:hypothetical protein n=1 Tax=Peptoniphilus sp. oral taxon 386 TaxID=652713 RepID=UPI0001DA9B8A|nr:hypothetical protein [Peptoniphilus sp. oral taxon 386]EFI42141.1 hypothetical protein HMPREF0629_00781 [Peptoniphilus sp. oral taxon 386 str. F0131]